VQSSTPSSTISHISPRPHVSPFDQAAVISVDGFGDFSSAAWGAGTDGEIKILGRVYFPHSLGIFYEALTQYLGFPHYGDEYKVMGLAPHGCAAFFDAMRKIVHLEPDGGFRLDLKFLAIIAKGRPINGKDRPDSANCSRRRSRICSAPVISRPPQAMLGLNEATIGTGHFGPERKRIRSSRANPPSVTRSLDKPVAAMGRAC
jgi:predicted NodU family carbamoyl transferase